MNFDEMLEAWRAQDQKPLFGVNKDLLQLVLQHEQANIRQVLRRDLWIVCLVGGGMAAFAGFWFWVLLYSSRWPAFFTVVAGICTGILTLWLAAFWLSRKRQARRERSFGNTLQEEVRRNLSLVEYQLSHEGRWHSALLWTLPPMLGALLLYWLLAGVNRNANFSSIWMPVIALVCQMCITYAASRAAERKLEPRRQRLLKLLETLNAID